MAETAAAAELRYALDDARRAGIKILDRSGCRISELLILDLEQVWTGRFDLTPKRTTVMPEYCVNHPNTRNPCGLCAHLSPGDDDD